MRYKPIRRERHNLNDDIIRRDELISCRTGSTDGVDGSNCGFRQREERARKVEHRREELEIRI